MTSNVTRSSSNVVSSRQNISSRDVMWCTPQTPKVEAFFGIAEFFPYRNAQITIEVNVYISLQHKFRSRYGGVSRVSVMEVICRGFL